VKGDDLPRAVAEDLLAVREPMEQQRANARRLTFPREIRVALKLLANPSEIEDRCLVIIGKSEPAGPPLKQWG
jgi:hypothetical protein